MKKTSENQTLNSFLSIIRQIIRMKLAKVYLKHISLGNNVYGLKLKEKHIIEFDTAILPFYLVTSYETSGVIYKWLLEAKKAYAAPEFSMFKVHHLPYATQYLRQLMCINKIH